MAITMEAETKKLDGLLALLNRCSASEACNIVQEHIQDARTYLLGAMNTEYRLNLELAREASIRIPDENIRSESETVLKELIEN